MKGLIRGPGFVIVATPVRDSSRRMLNGELDHKATARTWLALNRNPSGMGLDDALYDGQTQTTALPVTVPTPIEPLKHVRQISRIDSPTGVPHPQLHRITGLTSPDLDLPASRREFQPIINKVG